MHVDSWIETPSLNEGEKWAKHFLSKCRRPAVQRLDGWIESHTLFCSFQNKRWRVVGASRLGDILLSRDHEKVHGYQERTLVTACHSWSKDP